MELKGDEHVILNEDGAMGFRRKLTLTDKRLILQKGHGVFKVTWTIEEEIPLVEIMEAYAHVESFTSLPILKLRLKKGGTRNIRLKLSDSQLVGTMGEDSAMMMKIRSLTDRWVNAINHQTIRLLQQNVKP